MSWTIADLASGSASPRRIVSGTLEVPAEGAWWLDAVVSGTDELPARVVVTLGEGRWVGAVHASAVDGGRRRVRVLGGAGGIATPVPDRYQQGGQTTVRSIAAELCALGGETLEDAPATPLGSWQRLRGTVGTALSDLARATGLRWRVSAAGGVVVYDPAVVPSSNAPGVLVEPDVDGPVYGVQTFELEPPCTVGGVAVEHVTGVLERDARMVLRPTSLRSQLRSLPDAMPHGRVFQARLVAQRGRLVDVQIDAASSRGVGPGGERGSSGAWAIRGIPLWPGLPGVELELRPGAGLLVLFVDADPRRGIAIPAPYGEVADVVSLAVHGGPSLRLEADRAVLDAPTVELGAGASHTLARGDAVVAWIQAIQSAQCGSPGSPLTIIPPFEFPLASDIESDGPGRTP